MSRFSRCAAVAVFTAVIASSGAYAATTHPEAAPIAGAHNGPSEADTRKQCDKEARTIWPSTSWDMQAQPRCRRTELPVRPRLAISMTDP